MLSIEIVKENLARLCHNHWSMWIEYLFDKCATTDSGDFIIPREFVDRWQKQIAQPYQALSEQEKEGSRIEAQKIIDLLGIE